MKNSFLALVSGITLALAWPTYGFPGLLFFAFVPLLIACFNLREKAVKNAGWKVFGLSYLSFFTWNIITTYWIYFSTPFGMLFAVLVNSLLMALVVVIYHKVAKRVNFLAGSTFLICLWICFEKLHLIWEFSWPWLNLGNAFSTYPSWIQWYEYTGTFGGTLWVWLVNILLFRAVLLYQQYQEKSLIYRGAFTGLLLILIPIAVSFMIKNSFQPQSDKQLEAVILQPNINPYTEKYNTTDRRIGKLLVDLANQNITDSTAIVVAPETVFADGTLLQKMDQSDAVYFAKELTLKHPKLSFLGGISLVKIFNNEDLIEPQTNRSDNGVWYNDYNSAYFVDFAHDAELYHKSKLVVGVENFPYNEWLEPLLGDIMIDLGGTKAMKTTQENRSVFTLPNQEKAAPIICYESVYGEFVTGYIEHGATFLTIITNDAWWKNTQGHQQHLSYARLRAIETRRSVVRSANTGISAFIDPLGNINKSLGYEQQGSLRDQIVLNTEKTFYVSYGDYLARIAQFIALFTFLFAFAKSRKSVG